MPQRSLRSPTKPVTFVQSGALQKGFPKVECSSFLNRKCQEVSKATLGHVKMVASVAHCTRCPPSDPPTELMCLGVEVRVRMDQGREGILEAKDALAASWTAFPHSPPQPPSSAPKLAGGAQPSCRESLVI